MTTITDTTIDLTSEPNVTDPADIDAADIDAAEPVPDTTTPTGELVQFPVDVLAPHPDNPRTSLGDLDEGSGFHLMRAIRTAVIWSGRPGVWVATGTCPVASGFPMAATT